MAAVEQGEVGEEQGVVEVEEQAGPAVFVSSIFRDLVAVSSKFPRWSTGVHTTSTACKLGPFPHPSQTNK